MFNHEGVCKEKEGHEERKAQTKDRSCFGKGVGSNAAPFL